MALSANFINQHKTCCIFSHPAAYITLALLSLEETDDFGGSGEGYSWENARRTMQRCKNCGALFFQQRINFLSMTDEQEDLTYVFLLPVTDRDEAMAKNTQYVNCGVLLLNEFKLHKGMKIWFDGKRWCVENMQPMNLF